MSESLIHHSSFRAIDATMHAHPVRQSPTCLCTTSNFLTNTKDVTVEMVIKVNMVIMVEIVKLVILIDMVIMV